MSRLNSIVNKPRRAKGISVLIGLLFVCIFLAGVARAQSAGRFVPPASDSGVDTDGDSLFNFLRLEISVEPVTPGFFFLSADLRDGNNSTSITTQSIGLSLDRTTTIALDLNGLTIRDAGLDGPYRADLFLFNDVFVPIDYNEHVTAAYNDTDFDTVPATFAPPYSDTGVDSDGDGLFNTIAVNASVSVTEPGTYTVTGGLTDLNVSIGLGFDSASGTLPAGTSTLQLQFSTLPMVAADVAGPYVAMLTLWTPSGEMLDTDFHTTGGYGVSQFDPIPAHFSPPHSDRGVDRDVPADGEYNVLQMDVRVNVTDPGVYTMSANLLNSTGAAFITSDSWLGPLSAGIHTLPLYFPGVSIRASGYDGPYFVNMTLYSYPPGGFPILIDAAGYVTQAYNTTDFQSSTPANLTGLVEDAATRVPIPFASVMAFNYLDSLSLFASADGSGNYSLNLYAGDWVLVIDDFDHQANLSRLSLSGATVHDVDLSAQRGTTTTTDLTLSSWEAIDVKMRSIGEGDNATFRLIFDWLYGNQDQFLDQQEFDAFLASFGIGLPTLPSDTADAFLVDGTAFDLVPGSDSLTFANITGPIDSTVPPEFELDGSYVSNGTIPSALSHEVRVRAEYDTEFTTNVYTIHLPSPFELVNFSASSLVAVSGLGTSTAIVDPLLDPTPFDSISSEWVALEAGSTDSTAPTIAGATPSPNPAEAGAPILFAATVTDDVGVQAVSVNVSDGSGVPLGNFTMSFNPATGKFEASQSFARVGTLSFTVWASDGSGNVASSTGSVVVRDTTAPTVTGTTDSPDPVELGATITISTQISDVIGIGSAKVEIKDPTNAVAGNFTMAHGSGTAYSYQFSPSRVGTYTYQITAADPSGNARIASGSFQVRDTTAPIANAGSDRSVNEGTTVTFDGTGSSDADGISSYGWTFNDNGVVTLSGSNPTYRFERAGMFTVTLTVTDPSGNSDTDTVVITVAATTGGISGTVVGPSGGAISGATVRLFNGTMEVATTTTNATGRFTFSAVPPGSYTVRVEAPGYETKAATVPVTAGGVAPVSVALVALGGGGPLGLGLEVWAILIAVLAAVAVGLLLLMRRRARPPAT